MGSIGSNLDANSVLLAFGLTLFAGLSTGIGGLVTIFWKKINAKIISIVLGFSAGVMIYLSFMEILHEAKDFLINHLGKPAGLWVTMAAFFGGVLIIAIIDKLIPSAENPHESHKIEEMQSQDSYCSSSKLLRTGLFTAFAITIHNFPEGIASFISALKDPSLGIMIAVAIAIHNIPEGMAVSIPVYCATGNRKKAFLFSLASGLSEPLGALVAYLILMPFINDLVLGILFAAVAGIMVFISFDELLPTAEEYGEHHLAIFGLMGGMALMAISQILFM
ncbi:MAG TPA: zinc transporter ZupT [Clostridiaceae bacterium]|jgi:ZIP family zinc transporter|nr:zinc transporter ZupT [Clostridiaceae bacterium]